MNTIIKNIGVNVYDNGLFEGQYITPNGMAYNSYLILDEKTCLLDTVDIKAQDEWIGNLSKELGENNLDYIVISHVEPDHSYSIGKLLELYPNVKVVGNMLTFRLLDQFYKIDTTNKIVVKDNDTLKLGKTELTFFTAPMVHWPEVMMSYESYTKTLFSADAFGKFGTRDADEDWACEARRYYFNIVGKYGCQTQAILNKLSNLTVKTICPLHGPVLEENISYYVNLYDIWSSYKPEKDGIFIAYSSVYGNTKAVAEKLYNDLCDKGIACSISDLARSDMAENIEDAFKYSKMVVATTTYENEIFPVMNDFLSHLKHKDYQNRVVGIIENGTWSPNAGKLIKNIFSSMKNIRICENMVTIKSSANQDTYTQLDKLKFEIISAK